MKSPAFTEILSVVQRDVTRVASHYPLVTGFFFKVMTQNELVDHYPWLLEDLFLAVTNDMVMTLSRLFEDSDDVRTACLMTFLAGVELHHRDDNVRPHLSERRVRFIANIAEWRTQIKVVNKRLALRRNADLAHNDLTKVGRSDITWLEIKDMIGTATDILKAYFSAYHDSDHRFVLSNVDHELTRFLKWTRLDDYAAHRAKEREERQARFKEWTQRRLSGDPTVPDRPPF